MGDRPLVSVLLPVFNGQRTIAAAIESVLAQTYPNLELVVVDDGSSDETAAVIARMQDRRLRLVTHAVNQGLVAALNTGLDACRGDLVARLDADDLAFPGRIDCQVAAFESNPDLCLCAAALEIRDEYGVIRRTSVPPKTHAEMAVALLGGNRIRHSSAMFRRATVLDAGAYDRRWFPAEDYDLWLRLANVGGYVGLPTTVGVYATSTTGISQSRSELQRKVAGDRTAKYFTDLLGVTPHTPTARHVFRAASILRGQLRRRGIPTAGLEHQAWVEANRLMRGVPPTRRWLKVLAGSPIGVTRAALDRARLRCSPRDPARRLPSPGASPWADE